MYEQLLKDIIDSMCLPCARRLLYFPLFSMSSNSSSTKYYWIMEYLNEKKLAEQNKEPIGCGICFGLLEKYSQTPYLNKVIDKGN